MGEDVTCGNVPLVDGDPFSESFSSRRTKLQVIAWPCKNPRSTRPSQSEAIQAKNKCVGEVVELKSVKIYFEVLLQPFLIPKGFLVAIIIMYLPVQKIRFLEYSAVSYPLCFSSACFWHANFLYCKLFENEKAYQLLYVI